MLVRATKKIISGRNRHQFKKIFGSNKSKDSDSRWRERNRRWRRRSIWKTCEKRTKKHYTEMTSERTFNKEGNRGRRNDEVQSTMRLKANLKIA